MFVAQKLRDRPSTLGLEIAIFFNGNSCQLDDALVGGAFKKWSTSFLLGFSV